MTAEEKQEESTAGAAEATLEELRRERDALEASWLRAQADYQNLRRRQSADIEAAVRRAQTPLLENVLLVLDHLDMALATPCTTSEAKALQIGVVMTRDQLVQALEREDVRAIPTDGPFDPTLHEAVATEETAEREPGTILAVVRTGWTFRGQVLRPAHVKVATAPARRASGDHPNPSEPV